MQRLRKRCVSIAARDVWCRRHVDGVPHDAGPRHMTRHRDERIQHALCAYIIFYVFFISYVAALTQVCKCSSRSYQYGTWYQVLDY